MNAMPAKIESLRISYLQQLNLLDTDAEKQFDQITQLAASFYDVPIALVSLVDSNRQWFKSKKGLDVCETDRDIAFCSHAIAFDEVMLINDARVDPRFKDNPLVIHDPHVVFYAGAVLRPDHINAIGTLCIIDNSPRSFVLEDMANLRLLADQVEELIRLHQKRQQLEQAKQSSTYFSKRLSAIVNSLAVGILRISATGQILDVNDFVLKLLGYTRDELLNQNVKLLMPSPIAEQHHRYVQNYLDTKQSNIMDKGREVLAKHKDGHTLPVHLSISCFEFDQEEIEFVGVLTDLTNCK
ncbi:MAG: PAS domain S-box protein [Oceanospirillales bacterium]|nr:MAG: PAS domain S-box protein [Oceanospirillales bacterium]